MRAASEGSASVSETEICDAVIEHFRSNDWVIYPEVSIHQGGRAIDIVALRAESDLSVAIEAKTSFSMQLLSQAYADREWANMVYVATPTPRGRTEEAIRTREMQEEICAALGLGWLHVSRKGHVHEAVAARIQRQQRTALVDICNGKHQQFGRAGSQHERYSPWRESLNRVTAYVAENPGCSVRQVAENVETHWRTQAHAVLGIKAAAKRGDIHDVDAYYDGRTWRMRPS